MGAFDDLVPQQASKGNAFADLIPKDRAPVAKPSAMEVLRSGFDTSILPDLGFGATEVVGAALQKLGRAGEAVTGSGALNEKARQFREYVEAKNAANLKHYQEKFDQGGVADVAGRAAGQAMATGPITPALAAVSLPAKIAGGAGIGAGASLLTPNYAPSDSFWKDEATKAGQGAMLGGGLSALFGGFGRAATISDDAGKLLDKKVRVTPGRAAGGFAQRVEEGAESIPIVGDMIRGKHRRAVEDFNVATLNDALSHIGQTVKVAGRAGVKETKRLIGSEYDDVLNQVGTVPLGDSFKQVWGETITKISELPKERQAQFAKIIENRLARRVENGALSADKLKVIDSELGYLARNFRKQAGRTGEEDLRQMADAIRDVQAGLRSSVRETAGPTLATRLDNANSAWAKFVRIEDASLRAGSKEGVFSPAALRSAVQKPDKRQMATGDALMQSWAENAERVLGPTVPDSGTPFRLLTTSGLLGHLLDPSALAAGLGIAAATSSPGQAAAVRAMREAPRLTNAAPYLGLLAGPLTAQSQPQR